MKYYYLKILFLLFQISPAFSQNNYSVIYNTTINKENKAAILNFNDTSSLFIYNKLGIDTSYSSMSGIASNSSIGIFLKISRYDSIGQLIYRNLNDKTLIIRQTKVGRLDPFMAKDDWVVIKWNILYNNTKTINGYICKKATGSFRGRDYTVWYSDEIKYPFGPWKLFGLPGLILEAYDKKGFVHFIAKSVTVDDKIKIYKPNEKVCKTMKENVYYLDHGFELFYENLKTLPLPKGMTIGPIIQQTSIREIRNTSLERKYEWEGNEKDKDLKVRITTNKN